MKLIYCKYRTLGESALNILCCYRFSIVQNMVELLQSLNLFYRYLFVNRVKILQ